jgi:hypothetical protein
LSNLKLIQRRIELSEFRVCAVKQLGLLDLLEVVRVGYYLDRPVREELDSGVEQWR